MTGTKTFVWQALLAALVLSPGSALAEVEVVLDSSSGAIKVYGLEPTRRQNLVDDPEGIFLQHNEMVGAKSMALSAGEIDNTLVVYPRFRLQPGAEYRFRLDLEGIEDFETSLSVKGTDATPPKLLWHSPRASVIPENTLRLYLMFSEPMALGQVGNAIRLERSDGSTVQSPFLNLGTELWDREQRRLTLLFDPGRIKQGVGPNLTEGAPLQSGRRYSLVISGSIKSAAAKRLGDDVRLPLIVGPAERRALDPSKWGLSSPEIGTRDAFQLRFDRIMDQGMSSGLITVVNQYDQSVGGRIESDDGANWVFKPNEPWAGTERLRFDHSLEDVAGNTNRASFDAGPGTIGKASETTTLSIF